MARTRTLAQLRTEARERAGMENSTFVTDSELTRQVNQSITELYDLLVMARGESYYMTSTSFNTVAGTSEYNLPSTFYKLVAVDYSVGGTTATMFPLNFQAERNAYQSVTGWDRYYPTKYLIRGSVLKLFPTPNAAHSVTVWYLPHLTDLSADGDTFDGINGWEEYVVVDVAMKALIKEESNVAEFMAQKAAVRQRIEAMASSRDAGQPERMIDIMRSHILEDF